MRHAHTKTLFAYWDSRRLGAEAPARADIAPGALSALLGNLFMLHRADSDHHIFRLAGTRLCALYQREFREQNFLSLWAGFDRAHMRALLEGALSGPSPAAAMAEAVTLNGASIDIELAFLPLRGPDGATDRILGLFQPMQDPRVLQGRPVIGQKLREIRPPGLDNTIPAALRATRTEALDTPANDR